jgi:APA family basic amino acid/polyamine antiporter
MTGHERPGAAGAPAPETGSARLERRLGAWDGALLTVGSVVGTGIFLTTGEMAKSLPHAGLVLLVWIVGGLLTLAGALTYAELGVLFPRAGGIYHFLKESFGAFAGFLYGWTSFVVIMSGGIAAIAVGFGEYFGAFVPAFGSARVFVELPFGPFALKMAGPQVSGALAILLLTLLNHAGLREGAAVQNLLTVAKGGALLVLALLGLGGMETVWHAATAPIDLPFRTLLAGLGGAMVAALWTYDGWYALTLSAGEVRNPSRDLPRGLIGGTAAVVGLYLLVNLTYVRALPIDRLGRTTRVAEAAAGELLGPAGARLVTGMIAVSMLGCLAATILYASRLYVPMAEDGVFFAAAGRVDPVRHTPTGALWMQGVWSAILALTGGYRSLYTWATFAVVLFNVAGGTALFVLRRTRPHAERPYRAWGYPVVPALFLLACLALTVTTLFASPVESGLGLIVVASGVPAWLWWRRRTAPRPLTLDRPRGGNQ